MNDGIFFELPRRAMVEQQLRRRGIRDERVLDAMLNVPRHEFVPEIGRHAGYEDQPMGIGEGQTISQPYMVAAMTEAAQVRPSDRVLEIGTGSGYQAAVLAYMGAEVFTIDRNEWLAETARRRLEQLGYKHVHVVTGDGSEGYPAAAPYNAILVTAGSPRVPEALSAQLVDGGRLVIPVGGLQQQTLQLIIKDGNTLRVHSLDPCQFVPLIGKQAWQENSE